MIIAIDYDETYSADPVLWDAFIKNAIERKHKVICVTMRYDNQFEAPDVLTSIGKICKVIFTGRLAKEKFLKKIGLNPDVWIDDRPYYIYKDSWSLNNE